MRQLTYAQAIREAHAQALARDRRTFVIGQGLWSSGCAALSLENLDREFGRDRIVDSPISEHAVTGLAIGAALTGMRPIVFHPRMDSLLLAADPIINQAANWSYLFGGKMSVPMVIRAVINRGGEEGAQHSQALQAMFVHVPGLKVVMPATPYDAKGLLMAAIEDPNPVLYIDDRWLYDQRGGVPAEPYTVAIGKAAIRRSGDDVTLIGTSSMAAECVRAAEILEREGVSAEVVDLRSLKPWDRATVAQSVRKTGLGVVADSAWRTAGVASEIVAEISALAFADLRAPIQRVTLPDAPAPCSREEKHPYYPSAEDITVAAWAALEWDGHKSLAAAANSDERVALRRYTPRRPHGRTY